MGFIPTGDNNTNSSTTSGNSSATQLRSLTDCLIQNPLNGQGLVYVGTRWQNQTLVNSLSNLSDCHITSPTSSQVLYYNGGTWINATVSNIIPIPYLSTDHDVLLTSLQNNDILSYNSSTTKWNNKTVLDISNIPQINHTTFSNIGTNTHSQIDSHISASSSSWCYWFSCWNI